LISIGPFFKLCIVFIALAFSIPLMTDSVFAKEIISVPADSPLTAEEMMEASVVIIVLEDGSILKGSALYVTVDNPANHIVPPGDPFDGVADLRTTDFFGNSFRCTATLLLTGEHVLTAAHCVTDDFGVFNTASATVEFEGDSGPVVISVSGFHVHPSWDGNIFRGNDIAVLDLAAAAPAEIVRFDIDRNLPDDVGSIPDKLGYGRSGTGNLGDTLPSGIKRIGLNLYDTFADTLLIFAGLVPIVNFVPESVLLYDFDNGLAANDAMGFFLGMPDLGLTEDEVNSAPGDSGGPSYTVNKITGVTSYSAVFVNPDGTTSDIDGGTINSSFGEFSGDTRVSFYASFVDQFAPPPIPGVPGVSILKSVDLNPVLPGTDVVYTYLVTNTSNTALSCAAVSDNLLGNIGVSFSLPNNGDTHQVMSAPTTINSETTNTGSVACTDPQTGDPVFDSSPVTVSVVIPIVSIFKSVDQNPVLPGTDVVYTYRVTNPGPPLVCAAVSDNLLGNIGSSFNIATGGIHQVMSAPTTINSQTTNTGSVTCTALGASTSASSTVTVNIITPGMPGVSILKSVDQNPVVPGTDVVYTYLVTNTGNTALDCAAVSDNLLGNIGVSFSLPNNGDTHQVMSAPTTINSQTTNTGSVACTDPQTANPATDSSPVTVNIITPPQPPLVGGELVPIDTTALLLAGVQSISMWMIPVVIAGIGIGVFVIIRRK